MPFLSYELKPADAAKNAGRFIKEGGAHAVKVEGGARVQASIKAMLAANIPVMGHLGLTPQSIHQWQAAMRYFGLTITPAFANFEEVE